MHRNRQLELQAIFEDLLGNSHVYFQPPESTKIVYPAIVYSRSDIRNNHAGNKVYLQHTAYRVTVITKDPDSIFVKKVSILPMCKFNRHYTANNLNHDVFTLYY